MHCLLGWLWLSQYTVLVGVTLGLDDRFVESNTIYSIVSIPIHYSCLYSTPHIDELAGDSYWKSLVLPKANIAGLKCSSECLAPVHKKFWVCQLVIGAAGLDSVHPTLPDLGCTLWRHPRRPPCGVGYSTYGHNVILPGREVADSCDSWSVRCTTAGGVRAMCLHACWRACHGHVHAMNHTQAIVMGCQGHNMQKEQTNSGPFSLVSRTNLLIWIFVPSNN